MKPFILKDTQYDEDSTYYMLNYNNLKAADIVLMNSEGLQSKVIAKVTQGKFSHAMIMSKDVTLIHATLDGGVFSYNPQRVLVKSADNITVLRLKNYNFTESQIDSLNLFLREKVGSLYSISEAIKARKEIKSAGNGKQFCSRLVAQAYEKIGAPLVNNCDFCTPNDFARIDVLYKPVDLVRKASFSDIEFANSEDKVLLNQIETYKWLEKVRKYALKTFRYPIVNQSDVSGFVRKHRIAAKKVVKYISKTGYCNTYLMDKEVNPWRYDENVCIGYLLKGYIKIYNIESIIKSFETTISRHRREEYACLHNFKETGDCYHKFMYLFYKKMASFMHDGVNAMKSALRMYKN